MNKNLLCNKILVVQQFLLEHFGGDCLARLSSPGGQTAAQGDGQVGDVCPPQGQRQDVVVRVRVKVSGTARRLYIYKYEKSYKRQVKYFFTFCFSKGEEF